jgi:Phosphodiester glycosidase
MTERQMSIAEHSVPPKRNLPRKPRKPKPSTPPKTFTEAILRLIGPLWNKWYGVPVVLLVLFVVGVWQVLNEGQRRAVVVYVFDTYYQMVTESYDIVITDIDTTQVKNSGHRSLWLFNPVPMELQAAFAETGHSVFVNDTGGRRSSKFTLETELFSDATSATLILKLHDAQNRLLAESIMTDPIEFFEQVRSALGETLLYGLDFDKYTLTRRYSLPRRRATLEAYALFLEARDQEAKNAPARAIDLMREAVKRDDSFAMGFWYLGTLLKRQNKHDPEAKKMNVYADQLDLDHPRIDDTARNPVLALLDASDKVSFERLNQYVELKIVEQPDYDIKIAAWRIDPAGVNLKLSVQLDAHGNRVDEIRKRDHGILAVNAGFFESDSQNRLNPAYPLKIGDAVFRPYQGENFGGALAISDGAVNIFTPSTTREHFAEVRDLVYSKPLMLEPGHKFVMLYNDYDRRNRTAVCTTNDHRLIVLVVDGGLSLYELADFLSDRHGRQGLPCDAALALTGGPSTQASFSLAERTLDIPGGWPVYGALVVTAR